MDLFSDILFHQNNSYVLFFRSSIIHQLTMILKIQLLKKIEDYVIFVHNR